MPIVIVTLIIQACFIFHVFRTGRPYWWAFIIFSGPASRTTPNRNGPTSRGEALTAMLECVPLFLLTCAADVV